MREIMLAVFLFVLIVSVSGCKRDGQGANNVVNSNATPTPAPVVSSSGKVVFALFDVSESTKSEAIRKIYIESFTRVLDKAGEGDTIVADAINDDSLGQSKFSINDTLPTFVSTTNNELFAKKQRDAFTEEMKSKRTLILKRAEALVGDSSRRVLKTKILDAMQLAERVFNTYKRPKKVLVIFSDMIEESDRYNFQRQPPTDALTQRLINEEKQAKHLPDLKGVRVYIVGAAASANQPQSSAAYTSVENFWLAYFRATGADLAKERYGAALLSFDE